MLKLESISKQYFNHRAIDDVSLNIEDGVILGLLGPNGAGKTTLMRMITGILIPDKGNIYYNGKKFNPNALMHKIGYMPEERGLYKKMKVKDHIVYLAKLKGLEDHEAIKMADDWLAKLDMEKWKNKKVEELSKGMSQKIQFISTIIHNPDIIILDEPFSGLDPINSDILKQEILKLSNQGKKIIISTHRMEQVEMLCDKIVLINLGKKLLENSLAETKQQYKENIFEVHLAEPVNINYNNFPFILKEARENSLSLKLTKTQNSNDILRYFLRRKKSFVSFNEVLPTIEQIFIKLIKKH